MNHCSRNAARTFANLSSVAITKTSPVESIHVGTADLSVMTPMETEYKVHVVSNIHHDNYFLACDLYLVFVWTQSSLQLTCLNICSIFPSCFFYYKANRLAYSLDHFKKDTFIATLTLALTTLILRMMLDASKRRLRLVLIFLVKCFNKQFITQWSYWQLFCAFLDLCCAIWWGNLLLMHLSCCKRYIE